MRLDYYSNFGFLEIILNRLHIGKYPSINADLFYHSTVVAVAKRLLISFCILLTVV
jgi:hypothetical protein